MTAIIEREDDGYVALCPELDIASQGMTIEEARANLIEALTLFAETAASSEVSRRSHGEVFFIQVEGEGQVYRNRRDGRIGAVGDPGARDRWD